MSAMKLSRSREGKRRAPSRTKRGFAALLVSAGLAGAACGGNVSVYYDNQGGSGAQPDAGGNAGSGGQGGSAGEGGACSVPSGHELTCDSGAISDFLYVGGRRLEFNGYALLLEDLEPHGDSMNAVVAFLNSECEVIEKNNIARDTTKTIVIDGEWFDVRVLDLGPGYTFGDKWAHVQVRAGDCGCDFVPGNLLGCQNAPLQGIVNKDERLYFNAVAAILEDVEAVAGNPTAAILSFIDEDCNLIKVEKIYEGETKTVNLDSSYEVTAKAVAAGSTSQWVDLDVRPESCGECLPHWSCQKPRLVFDAELGEGESFQFNEFELTVNNINEHVGPYDGISCPVSNVVAQFTLDVDGSVSAHSMPMDPPPSCLRSPDGCYSLNFNGASIDFGPPQSGTCPILDERVSFEIRQGN